MIPHGARLGGDRGPSYALAVKRAKGWAVLQPSGLKRLDRAATEVSQGATGLAAPRVS